MQKQVLFVGLLLAALVALSLVPLGQLISDWIRYVELVDEEANSSASRGFDWVHWDDRDGQITAVYVFPKGSGYNAGIRTGDVLYEFDFEQYFNAEVFKLVTGGIPPGQTRTYTLLRGTEMLLVEVSFGQYPTFLYPLGSALWTASIWGFVLGAFIHLLALIIVIPLSVRARSAFLSLLLISASAIWVFGNLGRIVMLTWFGPADAMASYPALFSFLTLGSLVGWIGFPVLLLHKVLWDIKSLPSTGWLRLMLAIPPFLLAVSAMFAIASPSMVAPITLESLIAPILFYVCCYIAAAAGFAIAYGGQPDEAEDADLESPGWSRLGSAIVVLVASLAALSVYGVVPVFGVITDEGAGWIFVAAQLLSVAPVLLVSFATLKYGKVDQVLRRALTYATVLGLFFLLFVGGLTWILDDIERLGAPMVLIAGLWAVFLLFLFDRGWRIVGPYTLEFFATDRQKARRRISEFSESMRSFVGVADLVDQSASIVAEVLDARHVCIHMRTDNGQLMVAHPDQAVRMTADLVEEVWPQFDDDRELWARNPELNHSSIPLSASKKLLSAGVAMVMPMMGEDELMGLFVLGRKNERGGVYTLEDVELVRSLASHLALAVERLKHVEREKELVRRTAESQLTALRAQINPHFLFNTLNAIAALIAEKPEQAEQTVEHLSAIFRQTLEAGGQPFIPLDRELALVGRYLAIEQIRFGERLRVENSIAGGLSNVLIPAFSIQTLVENAVKHGVSRKREGGLVRISAKTVDPSLLDSPGELTGLVEIEVFDTGVGIPSIFGSGRVNAGDAAFFGMGLNNVASRLEKLYDRDDLLSFESAEEQGTSAIVWIPRPVQLGITNSES